jgi:hypothetical protein
MSGKNGGKLGIRAMAAMWRFRTCLEGHLDEIGVPEKITGKEILQREAPLKTVVEMTNWINERIDPYMATPEQVRNLLNRLGVIYKSPEEGKPWSGRVRD